jgi:hypothetical protein
MTYEEWVAKVLSLLKPPKEFTHFEEDELLPRLWQQRQDAAAAVCFLQELRDGGEGYHGGLE